MTDEKRQAIGWKNRDNIQIGDKFLWKFHTADGYKYGTSGRLKKKYMFCGLCDISVEESAVLTICRIKEGHNGYGQFVDYWLNESGICVNSSQIESNALIINGYDALRMERVK